MKIVHIAPNSPYNDYWGYQENLLPKYQKYLGNDVTVITTNTEFENGSICKIPCSEYDLSDGVHIIRMQKKEYPHPFVTSIKSYLGVYSRLVDLEPDFIYFHGLISSTIFDVIRYKKEKPNCVIVQDNHMDYNIGYKVESLRDLAIRAYYRWQNRRTIPYVAKVYGVTPWRKRYAEEYFKIPKTKTDLLIMGADDEEVNFDKRVEIRDSVRNKYNIEDDTFFIVSGGKIDKRKKTIELMKAVSVRNNVRLVLFGSVSPDISDEFNALCECSSNIIFVGWVESNKVYDLFFAADLAIFPGQHSVLWEQACASKIPCVFEQWEGMDHINNGGNSDYINDVSEKTIGEKIDELHFTSKYYAMREVAQSHKTDIYLYSKIAEKSLECMYDRG